MAVKDNTNWKTFDREIKTKMIEDYNRKAVLFLAQLGERVVRYAREDMSQAKHYTDRTGNLRNSIGYIIVQDGRLIRSAFTGATMPTSGNDGSPNDAHSTGLSYAQEVAKELSKSKTYLVWVAGMHYASAVEAKGFDVITGSGDWIEANATKERAAFKRYLMSSK